MSEQKAAPPPPKRPRPRLDAINRPFWTGGAEGKLNIILQGSEKPDPRLPNVPTPFALAKTDADVQALRLFLARAAVGRPFVAPGGVPADRIGLREVRDLLALRASPEQIADIAAANHNDATLRPYLQLPGRPPVTRAISLKDSSSRSSVMVTSCPVRGSTMGASPRRAVPMQ